MIVSAVKCSHYVLCIALRHFDEAVVRHKIDVPHLLTFCLSTLATSRNVLIDELHNLSWIEALRLAEIDEQTCIAFLCTALWSAVTSVVSFATSFFFALAIFLVYRLFNVRFFSIVSKESAELSHDNFLNDIVLVEIFEVSLNLLEERIDCLVVDIDLRNLVHYAEQLLLAYLSWRRQSAFIEFLLYDFLNGTHFELFASMYDGDRRALLSCTSGSARAVSV